MHLNWLMPLGGVLQGTLPNPDFSASAYIAQRVFGARPARPNDILAGSGVTATLSAGTVTLTATGSVPVYIFAFSAAHG